MKIKAGIINFPGSNCIDETLCALLNRKYHVEIINYKENNLENFDLIVLPGGFSWGDYISAGRIAKFSPVINAIKNLKQKPFLLGICNGFQILLESGFLKGALIENINQKFLCDDVELVFQNKTFNLPIANKQGRYYIDDLDKIKNYELIKYKNNPNGSINDIAGIYDKKNKTMGLMPHPERNMTTPFKNKNGNIIFDFIEKEIYGTV